MYARFKDINMPKLVEKHFFSVSYGKKSCWKWIAYSIQMYYALNFLAWKNTFVSWKNEGLQIFVPHLFKNPADTLVYIAFNVTELLSYFAYLGDRSTTTNVGFVR